MAENGGDDLNVDDAPFALTARIRERLAMQDEDHQRTTWDQLKAIIGTVPPILIVSMYLLLTHDRLSTACNSLDVLKRVPSDFRRYVQWSAQVKESHGSVMNFLIQERLYWNVNPVQSGKGPSFEHRSDIPFADPRDYAVLKNDWPYDFEDDITHLVVWSRTPIAVDDEKGDLLPHSRAIIDAFVVKHFVEPLGHGGRERILWFKNWTSIQSIPGVDHVHVMIRDAPQDLLAQCLQRTDL